MRLIPTSGPMRALLPVWVAVLLSSPSQAFAKDISFLVSDGGELGMSFGLEPLMFSGGIETLRVDGELIIDLEGGSAQFVSGPLLDLVVDSVDGQTIYTYGPGTLTVAATFFQTWDQTIANGTFEAATLPFSIRVCEGCEFDGSGIAEGIGFGDGISIGLGAGVFDEALARFLGVSRNSTGNYIGTGGPEGFILESVTGDPNSVTRFGGTNTGFVRLNIDAPEAEVPEPAPLLLALTAGSIWLSRRHRR